MAPSPTIRRLLKETKELSASAAHPNPAFYAAPVSDDNLHEWHFTILGPPAPSPYAGGIYHGRISLPPAYPMKPPNFRFLTPSGRFEVNREICLSISGFHEETWQPAWGVRTALVALRGFMGEEGTAGQVGGLESTREVRERLAKQSRSWSCSNCGGEDDGENKKGWTNEERLAWWWELCRGKGVNVEEECEGMEALPDGMKVETREVRQLEDKGKQRAIDLPSEDSARPSPPSNDTVRIQSPIIDPIDQSISADTATSTNPLAPQPSQNDTGSSTSAPGAPAPPQQLQPVPMVQVHQQAQQAESPITIDRAITVVVLALFIMILKKMFYPSGSGTFGYDELRLMRE